VFFFFFRHVYTFIYINRDLHLREASSTMCSMGGTFESWIGHYLTGKWDLGYYGIWRWDLMSFDETSM